MLAAADGGADDVDAGRLDASRSPRRPKTLRRCGRRSRPPGSPVESADLTMLPKTTVEIEDEAAAKKLLRLMDALEDNDDVQDVYANFDIPERVLEAVAARDRRRGSVPASRDGTYVRLAGTSLEVNHGRYRCPPAPCFATFR